MNCFTKTKGAAKEYAPISINPVIGCSNDCDYCYMLAMRKRFKYETDRVTIKPGFLDTLRIQAPKKAAQIIASGFPVMLSFTTDPFCDENLESNITYDVLKILFENNIPVAILTKSTPNLKLLDLIISNKSLCSYGISIAYSGSEPDLHEPNAAVVSRRIDLLKYAHEEGLRTFASFEPIVDLEFVIESVKQTRDFTDLFMFGLMSGEKQPIKTDSLQRFIVDLPGLCKGTPCYIKDSIRKALPGFEFDGNSGNATLKTTGKMIE